PSKRSRSNHADADHSPAWTGLAPSVVRCLRSRLRPYLAGSPVVRTESTSLAFSGLFGTARPLPAALHLTLRPRSCLPLPPPSCRPTGNDFHILSSWYRSRTRPLARERFRKIPQ